MCNGRGFLLHGFLRCLVDIPPELDDVRIGLAPGIHQGFELIFGHAGFERSHGLERPHRPTVTTIVHEDP